eukprot:c459_g1_i1.p1 GENE.c459_g1_i1~~c459_g1_i1.p1  ORF type:complete len:393 (+),score=100.35 c459_g1_i1:35-1180(+)
MAAVSTPFFLSVPAANSRSVDSLQGIPASQGTLYKLTIPQLRVGTMESLLSLTDDLNKYDLFIDSVVKKIARQSLDLAGGNVAKVSLAVEGVSVPNYVRAFAWDEQRFPAVSHPPQLVDTIRRLAVRIDEQQKTQFSEFNEMRSKLQGIIRKSSGSLVSRSIADLVPPADYVNTEYLATVFVCVRVVDAAAFLAVAPTLVECTNFETMEKFSAVVPQSTKKVAEDPEYALYAVYVLKKMADDFRRECLARKFIVRDMASGEAEAAESTAESREDLESNIETRARQLQQWCAANFGEVVIAWVHLKIIRVFTESVLRFGLPAEFITLLMEPMPKAEKKVRSLLATTFASLSVAQLEGYGDEDGGEVFYPYVSVDMPFDILKL